MKKNILKILLLSIGTLVLGLAVNDFVSRISERKHFAEKPVSAQLSSPTDFSVNMQPISIENISELQEISFFHQEGSGMVVALAEAPVSSVIQAVYENGTLIQWDSIIQKIVAVQNVFAEESGESTKLSVYQMNAGVNFNRDGSFLITPSKILRNQLHGEVVWNTNSRTFTLKNERFDFQALRLHPTLDIGFTVFDESKDISFDMGVGSKFLGGGSLAVERYGTSYLTRIALDPMGDYLAVVDVNSTILVGDISTFSEPEQEGLFQYATPYRLFGYSGKAINTVDLKFDETHFWLGWLTHEKLVVWGLKNYIFPLEFETNLEDGNTISFDRTGKILAVATQNGVKVFDIEKGKEVAHYAVGDVTALYFTRDNRLMIWGDTEGNIHLWGVIY
jgi:WD40 repeat protein